jgi:hypothetical protein
MPEIPFVTSAYKRDNGDQPLLRRVNMLVEANPTKQTPDLISRLPLVEDYTAGSGPIWGEFQQDGALDGDTFTVSGTQLYRNTTLIGTIAGSGPVRMAASSKELVIVRTQTYQAYSYNGTDLQIVALADGDRPVIGYRSVAFVSGLFIYVAVTDGTVPDHYWFWSAPLDGRTIDDLDFAAAESEADALLDALARNDVLYLLGGTSGEVWRLTGVATLPFSRISMTGTGRGVFSANCAEVMDNTVYFAGNDRMVYRMEDVAKRVSNHAVEEALRASTTCRTFQWAYEGHLFLAIRLDTSTWALDLANGDWGEFATYGRDNWAACCAVTINGIPRFGDDTTGKLWTFGAHGNADSDAEAFERLFTAGFPLTSGPAPVDNILVDGNAGSVQLETGLGSDPRLECRASRDGGKTWTTWRSTRFGRKGEYRRNVRYGGFGSFGPPGALFQFRLADLAPLRISYVRVNESLAGRGW